jgi:hypothetical protein
MQSEHIGCNKGKNAQYNYKIHQTMHNIIPYSRVQTGSNSLLLCSLAQTVKLPLLAPPAAEPSSFASVPTSNKPMKFHEFPNHNTNKLYKTIFL